MGSTTAKGYPYPVGTDRVMDGDNAIQALAEAVDTHLGRVASGFVNVNITTAGGSASVAVTMPVGRFTATPIAVANATAVGNPGGFQAAALGASASSITVGAARNTSTGNVGVNWLAVQAP